MLPGFKISENVDTDSECRIPSGFGNSVPGPPKLPAAAGIAVPLITQRQMTSGASGAPGGERGGGRVARSRRHVRTVAGKPRSPGPARPACETLCCLPPPSRDKPRRECGEPTFTTGTSAASLLNPVSSGYQHRAGNVMRPAAAATSARRDAVRAPRVLGSSVHTAGDSRPQVPSVPATQDKYETEFYPRGQGDPGLLLH